MRKMPKILATVMAAALMFGVVPPVEAQAKEDLVITTNVNKDLEIPLTLDASTDDFYVNGNLNPGDTMSADVIFKNVSDKDIQVRISDITDQLQTTMSQKLLGVLDLTIDVDGAPQYKGKHDKVPSPLTKWMTLGPNEDIRMSIRIDFSKYEADNTFQGAEMKVKYVFEARADVPLDDPSNSKKSKSETIKTGIDDVESTNPLAVAIVISAVCVVAGFGIHVVVKRRKEKEQD